MNILVTGATGFIGHHLLRHVPDGCRCFVLARATSNTADLPCDGIYVFDGNIDALAGYMGEHHIEGIIHLAAYYVAQHTSAQVRELVDVNAYFGTAVLEAASHAGVRWFLNAGTIWQNYNVAGDEYCPVNLYAAIKQAFIDVARYYQEACGLRFCTLKLSDTYGEDDNRKKVFALFKRIAETGETLAMSPGNQKMDVLHVDDVVSGFWHLAGLLQRNEPLASEYRLSSGELYSLRELAELYARITHKTLHIDWGGRPYREREVMLPWQGGQVLPGWQPKISFQQGLLQM